MFGMLRPCRHRLPGDLAAAWTAHLCGLCLALRDAHGHLARLVTNTDAVAISALVEAQTGTGDGRRRAAGPCALRGMQRASVTRGESARLAAAVSLTLAAATLEDHVVDRDTGNRLVVAGSRLVAGRAARAAARDGDDVGFATTTVLESIRRQGDLERLATATTPLLSLTAPTEQATAAAFAHTAVIAGRPGNAATLAEAGTLFGRLAHLLDAVEDLTADRDAGRFNPVEVTGTDLAAVRALCDDAVLGIRLALQQATFHDARLVHRLLVHETGHAVDRAFRVAHHGHAGTPWPPPAGPGVPGPAVPFDPTAPPPPDAPSSPPQPALPPPLPVGRRRGLLEGCAVAIGLCCTGKACCGSEYEGAWSRKKREGCCYQCCDCGDCCSCGDCCDCSC